MMSAKKFDEIVKARAKQRAEERIKKFKQKCLDAARELFPDIYLQGYNISRSHLEPHRSVFAILASDDHTKGWPKRIWEYEEAAVEKELLSIMDEMQKALIAVSSAKKAENEPEEPKGKEDNAG